MKSTSNSLDKKNSSNKSPDKKDINKINNIKSLIKSDQKSFLTYINDTKVSLNKIIMKSKEISILIMTHNKQKNPIDIEILSSEIKLKEDEIINVKKEMSYYKDKYNSINQSFIEAQKTVSDLKEEKGGEEEGNNNEEENNGEEQGEE